MTRRRPKRQHRPMASLANPLAMLMPASKDQRDRVMLTFLSALDAIASGANPGSEDWRVLSDCINTVETLAVTCKKLDHAQAMPVVNAAIAAMVGAVNRFKAGKAMRFDAQGLQAVRDVVDLYGQCAELLTEREMTQARDETVRRMRALLLASATDSHNEQVIAL